MNREDFTFLNKDVIYFDNAATTLKPKVLAEKISEYYNEYSVNTHRGDYDISLKVNSLYENTRELVKDFIGAESTKEIVYTSGTTDSLNKIIFGYFKNNLKKGDEILLTKGEHASMLLPWFELADDIGLKIKYISLEDNYELTIDNVKKELTSKTKVISLAHVTNVLGDIRPIKEITELAHLHDIKVLIDGAQSVPHMAINVTDLDIDFLTFSAHKMCGPTGLGILYGKKELLRNMKPILFGGGMNASFKNDGTREYKDIPTIFEAGTPNIAAVIGFGEVIKYINNIGMDKINEYELELKNYAVSKLDKLNNIIIHSKYAETGIVTFSVKEVFSQDVALYLNEHDICVRAGNHCAKILNEEIGASTTVRASFYFYNTKEEIDKLVKLLKNPNILNEVI
jgi:Selenocysteine lyase